MSVNPRARVGVVGMVLARDGFGAVGVNAIARQAGVDKVLTYRHFGGLPERLRAWGERGPFWPRVAGVQYLLLRSRRIRLFGGVDLRGEAGWLQFRQSIRALARDALAAAPA
ncbi:MAG: helix-turn-helix domain-containing protein [Rubrivivax sp.]|nr:helix-turn-helix domain-containing protein [Rubrivivax sp.]